MPLNKFYTPLEGKPSATLALRPLGAMYTSLRKSALLLSVLLCLGSVVACGNNGANSAAGKKDERSQQDGKRGVQGDIPELGEELVELMAVDGSIGLGDVAERGDVLELHYQGWIYNPDTIDHKGQLFERSRSRGKPYRFRLGAGRVIRGWDHGLLGMRDGGKRTLFVPADMAYGERGYGNLIPAGSALLFEIDLLAVYKNRSKSPTAADPDPEDQVESSN